MDLSGEEHLTTLSATQCTKFAPILRVEEVNQRVSLSLILKTSYYFNR